MKLTRASSYALHAVAYMALQKTDKPVASHHIAQARGIPERFLLKVLKPLVSARVLMSVKGPNGGYRLARPPSEITLLEVVEAIDGDDPAFRCTEIRRRGPLAMPAREYKLPCGIHAAFDRADDAWRAELRATTIADMFMGVLRDVPRPTLEKGARWLDDAVR